MVQAGAATLDGSGRSTMLCYAVMLADGSRDSV
jgi:hypothetical protein